MSEEAQEMGPPGQGQIRLKGHVVISRTVNLGSYSSLRVEVKEEYGQSQVTLEEMFDNLLRRVDSLLTEKGIVK
jgi:hypothetical protein